ncbi:putative Ubiquitin elongating factor core [Blattamonas nauphoetae]|uniref:Ubiquitin elongating factor core n=1 Tax=Blattamonas nauphoetae TaxID=2049346 RepID=A0ABQ9YA49_9EUKA|nr:putative Ubiquitin elongating factor core [Blattamonas nauphoetae]
MSRLSSVLQKAFLLPEHTTDFTEEDVEPHLITVLFDSNNPLTYLLDCYNRLTREQTAFERRSIPPEEKENLKNAVLRTQEMITAYFSIVLRNPEVYLHSEGLEGFLNMLLTQRDISDGFLANFVEKVLSQEEDEPDAFDKIFQPLLDMIRKKITSSNFPEVPFSHMSALLQLIKNVKVLSRIVFWPGVIFIPAPEVYSPSSLGNSEYVLQPLSFNHEATLHPSTLFMSLFHISTLHPENPDFATNNCVSHEWPADGNLNNITLTGIKDPLDVQWMKNRESDFAHQFDRWSRLITDFILSLLRIRSSSSNKIRFVQAQNPPKGAFLFDPNRPFSESTLSFFDAFAHHNKERTKMQVNWKEASSDAMCLLLSNALILLCEPFTTIPTKYSPDLVAKDAILPPAEDDNHYEGGIREENPSFQVLGRMSPSNKPGPITTEVAVPANVRPVPLTNNSRLESFELSYPLFTNRSLSTDTDLRIGNPTVVRHISPLLSQILPEKAQKPAYPAPTNFFFLTAHCLHTGLFTTIARYQNLIKAMKEELRKVPEEEHYIVFSRYPSTICDRTCEIYTRSPRISPLQLHANFQKMSESAAFELLEKHKQLKRMMEDVRGYDCVIEHSEIIRNAVQFYNFYSWTLLREVGETGHWSFTATFRDGSSQHCYSESQKVRLALQKYTDEQLTQEYGLGATDVYQNLFALRHPLLYVQPLFMIEDMIHLASACTVNVETTTALVKASTILHLFAFLVVNHDTFYFPHVVVEMGTRLMQVLAPKDEDDDVDDDENEETKKNRLWNRRSRGLFSTDQVQICQTLFTHTSLFYLFPRSLLRFFPDIELVSGDEQSAFMRMITRANFCQAIKVLLNRNQLSETVVLLLWGFSEKTFDHFSVSGSLINTPASSPMTRRSPHSATPSQSSLSSTQTHKTIREMSSGHNTFAQIISRIVGDIEYTFDQALEMSEQVALHQQRMAQLPPGFRLPPDTQERVEQVRNIARTSNVLLKDFCDIGTILCHLGPVEMMDPNEFLSIVSSLNRILLRLGNDFPESLRQDVPDIRWKNEETRRNLVELILSISLRSEVNLDSVLSPSSFATKLLDVTNNPQNIQASCHRRLQLFYDQHPGADRNMAAVPSDEWLLIFNRSFIDAMFRDANPYNIEFMKLLGSVPMKTKSQQVLFDVLADLIAEREKQWKENDFEAWLIDNTDDFPEEIEDPLVCTPMRNPCVLPDGNHVDLDTISKAILQTGKNPFNNQPLSLDKVKPDPELQKISDEYFARKKTEFLQRQK